MVLVGLFGCELAVFVCVVVTLLTLLFSGHLSALWLCVAWRVCLLWVVCLASCLGWILVIGLVWLLCCWVWRVGLVVVVDAWVCWDLLFVWVDCL